VAQKGEKNSRGAATPRPLLPTPMKALLQTLQEGGGMMLFVTDNAVTNKTNSN